MDLKIKSKMPAMLIVGLMAILAMFAVSTAATSNSGGASGLSDQACKALADSVVKNVQSLQKNPNVDLAGDYGNCARVWSYKEPNGKALALYKESMGCMTYYDKDNYNADYTNKETVTNINSGAGYYTLETVVHETANSVTEGDSIVGSYSREITPGNSGEPEKDNPGRYDAFTCYFGIGIAPE